jgi:hypothetical protein
MILRCQGRNTTLVYKIASFSIPERLIVSYEFLSKKHMPTVNNNVTTMPSHAGEKSKTAGLHQQQKTPSAPPK